MITLTPAYGRDYRSQDAVLKDWDKGKDFIMNDAVNRWDGKPINKYDAEEAGIHEVKFRYNNLKMVFHKTL